MRCAARFCTLARSHAHTDTHLLTSACAHARSIIITDYEFECARLTPRPRSVGANLEYVILQGSLLSRTKALGHVGIAAAYTLSPADTRLSPQHWLGAAGCNSRAGLVRFTLAQADYDLGHGRHEVVRLAL